MKALLPCAAMLALSMGCSSSSRGRERASASPREAPTLTAQRETRDQGRRYETSGERTTAAADPRRSTQGDAEWNRGDDRRAPAPARTTGTGVLPAGEQDQGYARVSSPPPPLSPAEIPSHEPRGDEFWIAGHWRGESGRYVWQTGRIERDRAGQLYVPASWTPSEGGWEYTPERWR